MNLADRIRVFCYHRYPMVEVRRFFSGKEMKRIKSEIDRSRDLINSFGDYCRAFDYTIESLKGLRILDVGAGLSDFATTAANFGAEVIKLDGKYTKTLGSPELLTEEKKENAIGGIVQLLPFKDNSFDEVISLCGLAWVKTGRVRALWEMIRVAKPNGRIKIYPTADESRRGTLIIHKNPNFSEKDWLSFSKNAIGLIEVIKD